MAQCVNLDVGWVKVKVIQISNCNCSFKFFSCNTCRCNCNLSSCSCCLPLQMTSRKFRPADRLFSYEPLLIFSFSFRFLSDFIACLAQVNYQLSIVRFETCSKEEFLNMQLMPTNCWRRSIVGGTLVSAGELSLSCARLLAGWVTTLWLRRPLSVSQHGQLSLPSLTGR